MTRVTFLPMSDKCRKWLDGVRPPNSKRPSTAKNPVLPPIQPLPPLKRYNSHPVAAKRSRTEESSYRELPRSQQPYPVAGPSRERNDGNEERQDFPETSSSGAKLRALSSERSTGLPELEDLVRRTMG